MKLLKGIGTGLSLTVLCLLVAPKVKADDSNQKTTVTLTDPTEVPGVGQHILPPGSYVFKLKNSSADRHIVEISNQNESQVLTTLLSLPNDRLKATGNSILTFSARPTGEPEALKAWFHAGEHSGEQFVWDSPRAIALAKQANESVLSTPVAMVSAPVDALNSAPIQAVNPNGETIETAQVMETTPAEGATLASASAVDPTATATALPVPQPAVAPTAPAVAVAVIATPTVDPAAVAPAQPVVAVAVTPTPTGDPNADVPAQPIGAVAVNSSPTVDPAAVAPAQSAFAVAVTPTPTVDPAAVVPAQPVVAVAVAPTPPVDPPVVAPAPPVEEAAAAPAPPVTSEPVVAPSLPHTSSHLPLIGLVGLLSLGVGFGLLGFSKLKA